MLDDSRILYKDKDLIVYKKNPGEDSEKLAGEPVGRLDKPVGGLMLLLLNTKLQEKIKTTYSKSYMACAAGTFDEAHSEGEMKDYLLHDRRANKVYPVKSLRKGVREASLYYKIVASREDVSLADINLNTGRTHQIRVQFASRKHPLAGDGKYGSRIKSSIGLFAYKIEFAHPVTNEQMSFCVKPDSEYPWNLFGDVIDQMV